MPKNINNKLTIGYVLDDGLDSTDGVQQYVISIGKWMAARGHEVHYIVGQTSRTDIPNVHSMARNLGVRFNGNTLTTPLPASAKRIKSLLSKNKFDVLHIQVPYSPFMAARVVKRAHPDTAIIGTFHILPYGKFQEFGSRILGLVLRRNTKLFNAFLSVSKPAQLFARNTYRIESTVLPNVVDIDEFRSSAKHQKNSKIQIVFLGRLVKRKGCLQLLQAINCMLQDERVNADFHLHIYGKGSLRSKLENYVAENNLSEYVTFQGYVSEVDKPSALSNADIAVFPSVGAESFGIVLIEAMAAGSGVVIGGNNPGYSSVLSDTPEVLFDPNNSSELASLLAQLIDDSKERQRIHRIQQTALQQFDINIVGEKLLVLYCKNKAKE
jgi:phosphatidylinositol alpha-mannosyltransferase